MKYPLILISVLLLMSQTLNAQKWDFVPELGYQESELRFSSTDFKLSKNVYNMFISLGAQYHLNDKWSVILPLNNRIIGQKHDDQSFSAGFVRYYPQFKNTTVAFMPSVSYKPTNWLRLQLGCFASRRIWEREYYKINDNLLYPGNMNHFVKDWDAGLVFGFKLHYKDFSLGFANSAGLVDINILPDYFSTKVFSSNGSVSIAYSFPLKKN